MGERMSILRVPVSENGPELAAEAHFEQHVQVFAVLECAVEPTYIQCTYAQGIEDETQDKLLYQLGLKCIHRIGSVTDRTGTGLPVVITSHHITHQREWNES